LSIKVTPNIDSFIATPEFTTAASAIKGIQNAGSKEEALQIAIATGLTKEVEEVEADNLQFITASKTQQGGVFNKTTGVFTPRGPAIGGVGGNLAKAQNDPTPANIRSTLASVFGDDSLDISGTTKTMVGSVIDLASSLEEFADANAEGSFPGLGAGAGFKRALGVVLTGGISEIVRFLSPEEIKEQRIQNVQFIQAINLKAQLWASGAALTEKQIEQVEELTPAKGDTDAVLRRKINGLYDIMIGLTSSRLLVEGVNIRFPKVDLFEFSNLLNEASDEQRQELELLLIENQ